ncbi:hypothetical protein [Paracoccus amoyensis]|nr:hypothetical protein [Paracoccus amoyensis]
MLMICTPGNQQGLLGTQGLQGGGWQSGFTGTSGLQIGLSKPRPKNRKPADTLSMLSADTSIISVSACALIAMAILLVKINPKGQDEKKSDHGI